MFHFKRGISQEFVNRLNAEYKAGGWWKDIADDRELFIAIRKDYINVYLNGNSLLKLWLEGDDLVGETHYKYLLVPESAQPYIKMVGGVAQVSSHAELFVSGLSNLKDIRRAANAYYGEEKKGVHQIVMSNPNVIDVEIAFSAENEATGKSGASRIDFAALRQGQDGPEVVFYEAKQFSNKELRASGGNVPVLEQLQRYEGFLKGAQTEVAESYFHVLGNLLALEGVKSRYIPMQEAMRDLPRLVVCPDVRLVVFGFDADQKVGPVWAGHRQKLVEAIGDRLLLKGDANGFTNGIA